MGKFKVGDRVRMIDDSALSGAGIVRNGECAMVVEAAEPGALALVRVQSERGSGRYFEDRFELVDTAPGDDANGQDTDTSKASNPKQVFGDLKAQLAIVPDTLAYAAAPAFFEGASKYGAYNWRAAGVRASTYKAACERHLKKWFSGELCDPKTGVPHLSSAIACLAIIVDAQVAGMLEDDRPPPINLLGMEEAVAAVQAGLREQHKDKNPKHWTAKDVQ